MPSARPSSIGSTASLVTLITLAGCASPGGAPLNTALEKQAVWAVTEKMFLIQFNADRPSHLVSNSALRGLDPHESLVGIDFRVARGVLYGVTSAGRLVTIDTASATVLAVGGPSATVLEGTRFGIDFNPAADRLRVVSDTGQNLRLHPETGALAAKDPPLSRADGKPATGIVAAAYTYNKQNEKLTTNYAIDVRRGWLVTQGSLEGLTPIVSPNTGRVADVGPLGTGPLDDASFDIRDTDNAALATLKREGRTQLYALNLSTGRGTLLGRVGTGEALRGIAIQP